MTKLLLLLLLFSTAFVKIRSTEKYSQSLCESHDVFIADGGQAGVWLAACVAGQRESSLRLSPANKAMGRVR